MYEQFFNLTAEPFRLSPDHRFCYNHAQYTKAKAYMAYAFMRAEGFVMVTGQPGTGKTTLIGDLVESLADENVLVAKLVSTQLAADDLLRMVAFAFGIGAEAADKSSILQQLTGRFLGLHREGGRALLIVDEAQDLNPEATEELRLLTNLQQDGKPLLQIFLLGQPELRDMIQGPRLTQVHQRIIATSHLQALKEEETRAYVEHRLHMVGWSNDPAISKTVFPIIFHFSEGIPRRINLICSRLFLHAFVEQRHQIGVADARAVVLELQEEQLSTRNLLNGDLFHAEDSYENPLPREVPLPVTSRKAGAAPGSGVSSESIAASAPGAEGNTRTVEKRADSRPEAVPAPGYPLGGSVSPLQAKKWAESSLESVAGPAVTTAYPEEAVGLVRAAGAKPDGDQAAAVDAGRGVSGKVVWPLICGALVSAGFMAIFVGVGHFL